jgi:hypothetical protein
MIKCPFCTATVPVLELEKHLRNSCEQFKLALANKTKLKEEIENLKTAITSKNNELVASSQRFEILRNLAQNLKSKVEESISEQEFAQTKDSFCLLLKEGSLKKFRKSAQVKVNQKVNDFMSKFKGFVSELLNEAEDKVIEPIKKRFPIPISKEDVEKVGKKIHGTLIAVSSGLGLFFFLYFFYQAIFGIFDPKIITGSGLGMTIFAKVMHNLRKKKLNKLTNEGE